MVEGVRGFVDVLRAREDGRLAANLGVRAQAAARGVELGLDRLGSGAMVRDLADVPGEVGVVPLVRHGLRGVALIREDSLGVELGRRAGAHDARLDCAS